uniref:signal peptidase II n=1 Tax=Hymenobacter sp. TaxID=1898978 RepID=UPI00286AF8B8
GGYTACMALILGGAVGNLIDSVSYGVIYDNAPFGSPTRWFYGQVIDMIFVPLYRGYFPASWPIIGGKYSSGFPIFNIADASISIGVALILLNQSRFFKQQEENQAVDTERAALVAPDSENRA